LSASLSATIPVWKSRASVSNGRRNRFNKVNAQTKPQLRLNANDTYSTKRQRIEQVSDAMSRSNHGDNYNRQSANQ
jgi:hypothetical protein